MNNKFFSVLITAFLLTSCAHIDSPSSNKTPSQEITASLEKFDLSNYHGSKLSVKVYPWRITDVDLAKFPILNNYHIGWGVSNRLTDILFDVERFKFYEEKQEVAASQMQSCKSSNTCKDQQSQDVQYIIYPEVYHLGIEKNTDINGFNTTNRQSIEIGIQIKLVDAHTGEIKAAGSYIGQKALTADGDIINNPSIDFSESALGKATDSAIKGAIAKMLKRLDGKGASEPIVISESKTPKESTQTPTEKSYRTFNANAMPTESVTSSKPYSEKRLALVIGNAKYKMANISLDNSVHDAEDISAELKKFGFDVSLHTNLSKREMEEAIDGFDKKLKAAGNGSVALFYYAGHAAEVQGINYMFPVDFQGKGEEQVDTEAVPVHRFVKQIKTAGNYLNVIILDACRDNPYSPEQRSFNTKHNRLATMNYDIDGMFYSYATASGEKASDGIGNNGLFTGNLLKYIPDSNLKIYDVFNKVGEAVSQANKDQIPWVNSSFHGVFYFNPPSK